ncbi:hypothetical protein EJ03DRAFT_118465 [Teratosphaeria nubilosa]|uniref:Uncharacterized protein n=1 Tax=Teratosphaeria nubilosa TaxID=161662 RepID=A0A6G1L7P9_9PEZI|nr:hypothetical protein EJ03DRAFT_118465 [Teratosphaeria nubilosa]
MAPRAQSDVTSQLFSVLCTVLRLGLHGKRLFRDVECHASCSNAVPESSQPMAGHTCFRSNARNGELQYWQCWTILEVRRGF